MVAKSNETTQDRPATTEECPSDFTISLRNNSTEALRNNNSTSIDNSFTYYDWSEELQGVILSSFYIGYFAFQIPSGLLASKYGGKGLLLISAASSSMIGFLTPTLTNIGGASCLIGARILAGVVDSATVPALTVLISAWIPLQERTRISAFILSGSLVIIKQVYLKL